MSDRSRLIKNKGPSLPSLDCDILDLHDCSNGYIPPRNTLPRGFDLVPTEGTSIVPGTVELVTPPVSFLVFSMGTIPVL